jgi:hypothetical protein
MKKTIYIAGKVTGLQPSVCKIKFERMEQVISAKGYNVINPIKLINNPSENWHVAMDKCLEALKTVDGIFMMPCSKDSPGAQLELQTAIDLNIDIYSEIADL